MNLFLPGLRNGGAKQMKIEASTWTDAAGEYFLAAWVLYAGYYMCRKDITSTDVRGWRFRAPRSEPDLLRSYVCPWPVCRWRIGRPLRSTSGCTLRCRHFNSVHYPDDLVHPTCARFWIDSSAWKWTGAGTRLAVFIEAVRRMVQTWRTRRRAWLVEHELHPWGAACHCPDGLACSPHGNRGTHRVSPGLRCVIRSLAAGSTLLLQGDVSLARLSVPLQRFPR